MESTEAALRYKVIIGKFPVIKVIQHGASLTWWVQMPQGIVFELTGPLADVREGDLLTFYTEVLANDKTSGTSIQ